MPTITTQNRISTKGLCHVAIDVSDMERSMRFYTDMFELDVVGRTGYYVHLRTPGAHDSFFLFQADGPVSPKAGGMTHMHFGFRIDGENFDKAMEYIEKNKVRIHPNPARGKGRFVYIEDPDGYVIQLEPGDCE